MLPKTSERVEAHTPEHLNREIRSRTEESIRFHAKAGPEAVARRLEELEREWDIERTLEANAATVSLLGLGLGRFVDRRWYALPAVVAGFLLQHALQGWCPPVPLFRRLGFRTADEIDYERAALKAIRGDFDGMRKGYGAGASLRARARTVQGAAESAQL